MPSAYRGKKRIPLPKRKQLKGRKPRPVKKTCHFRRGAQAKPKPVKKIGKRKPNSPALNDSKTLQQLRKDNMYMTTKAKGIMISFVKNLYKWVSIEAERLRREKNRPSIGFIEMRTALRSVMPGKCNKCRGSTPKGGGPRFLKTS
ncbi:H2B.2H2B.2-like [Podarcis lilfordi]|uniref:H2B.2H2B.2-like n=1 Tax=Podarcis lilfordi TaxID=74358 RepID=A0AA35P9S2_9SAUR|nr:H2B.2H2B.2-like [Podarcis lilfordi]